jgi:hypothetical protein
LTGDIVIPDVSGELWLNLYKNREWPVAWDKLLSSKTGFVLFVQAGSPLEVPSLDWVTCERYYNDTGKMQSQTDTPTQVLLVDWVQIVRYVFNQEVGASAIPKLSIVVSAWDRVSGEEGTSPAHYLASRYPMFSDYLASQGHRFDVRVFGVSVASGDLDKDPTFRESYMSGDPATQGFAVSGLIHGRLRREDVLLPVYWALNEGS